MKYRVTHTKGTPVWGIEPTLLTFSSRGEAAAVCNELNHAYEGAKEPFAWMVTGSNQVWRGPFQRLHAILQQMGHPTKVLRC